MKVLAGRPQDEEDVLGMAMAQASSVDWRACLALARDLGEAVGQDLVGRIQAMRERVQELT
jgi:hypothetical protein